MRDRVIYPAPGAIDWRVASPDDGETFFKPFDTYQEARDYLVDRGYILWAKQADGKELWR